jgi:hypothetical protein
MKTDISGLDLKDATIVRVIEETDARKLTFELSYPLTENNPDFERKNVTFWTFSRYLVEEGDHFLGHPSWSSVNPANNGVERTSWSSLAFIL